jgi:hypothetical protein
MPAPSDFIIRAEGFNFCKYEPENQLLRRMRRFSGRLLFLLPTERLDETAVPVRIFVR